MRTRLARLICSLAVLAALLPWSLAARAQEKSRLDIVLERGKLIVAALSPTPPFAFTDDKGHDEHTVANLNNPQMAERAKKFFPKAKTLTFDTPSAEFLAVQSGRADALQIDTAVAEYFANTNKDQYDVLPQMLTPSQNNGFYLKPGDFKWWLFLDTTVGELRSGSWYPRYVEVYQKWFGKNPPPQKFYVRQ